MSWYWQKDLRKNGDAKDAWEPYSSEENTKIERAFKKDQKTLKLSEKYKIDFKDMIQFRPEDRDRQRAIKRVDNDEDEDDEEEMPKKKKAKIEKEKPKKKTEKKEISAPNEVKKKKALPMPSKKLFRKMVKRDPLTSFDFYIKSGKVLVGTEGDVSSGVNVYNVKKGKWTLFQSEYIQACYHESVDATLLEEDYLGELSKGVLDSGNGNKDFKVTKTIGRYDWGMDDGDDERCMFFHFVDKDQATDLVEGHNTLGEHFWNSYHHHHGDIHLTSLTQVFSNKKGGGVCFYPEQEYRYGYLCTNKKENSKEATLFVVYGYEALDE